MGRRTIVVLGLVAGMLAGRSWAEAGPPTLDLSVDLGGGALVTDAAGPGVKRGGLDLSVWADLRIPGVEALAPQAVYEFIFLPGKAGVHRLGFGARVRLFRFFSKPPVRDDLVFSMDLGYVYAPTTTGDKNWFGYSAGLSYMVTRWSPVEFGPYFRLFHVVFKDARDPVFVTFGLTGSFSLFGGKGGQAAKPKAAPGPAPEVMAEPDLQGKPGDRDGDGVGDASDLCPISAPGTKVDERGCMVLKGKMVLPDVHFDKGQTRLSGRALLALKRLADVVRVQEGVPGVARVTVTVWAYAESGEPAGIAAKRAARIREALVRYGVPAGRVGAQAAPVQVVDLDRPLGPWWGRRVVFRFHIDFAPKAQSAEAEGEE